jgi:hypothetical protein
MTEPVLITHKLDLSLLGLEVMLCMIEEYYGAGGLKNSGVFRLDKKEYDALLEGVTIEAIQDKGEEYSSDLSMKKVADGVREIHDMVEDLDGDVQIEIDFNTLMEAL